MFCHPGRRRFAAPRFVILSGGACAEVEGSENRKKRKRDSERDPSTPLRSAQDDRRESYVQDDRLFGFCELIEQLFIMNDYYVYILTNSSNKVMYIGITNNLERRVFEHKHKLIDGFTKRYHVHRLVFYEQTSDVNAAIAREKQLKGWVREKKNRLVESQNPQWKDLSEEWQ